MNRDRAQGNWKQLKGWLRANWGRVNRDTSIEAAGMRDVQIGKLQEAYGIGKDEADRRIEEWQEFMRDAAGESDASPGHVDARR